ncbi:MAG TPA: serine acetyltransferase [Clostridiales bacterium]|jgi:serine O-acetyltransferase|nr:serine acetyltransferase [Candidatus Apopatosoma intestinale]HBO65586.1 serine acetyltransferase [Candidatus Apopatosoma intestinale]
MEKNETGFLCEVAERLGNIRKENTDIFDFSGASLPDRDAVIDFIHSLKRVLFLGYFGEASHTRESAGRTTEQGIRHIYETLKNQLCLAFRMEHRDCRCRYAAEIAGDFICRIPALEEAMLLDLEAAFVGDPAAKSKSEIICSYPGFLAIFVYRAAHILYEAGVPLIPRIMTEYAHSRTGIDINAGATIGRSFFIDHGTGVVIGETTVIGDNVKIYQGVTLGALSTRLGRKLGGKKRHPTIENDVTIYSGATILGGDTVIGEGSVIGGNVFITESVPKNMRVSMKAPELVYKEGKHE